MNLAVGHDSAGMGWESPQASLADVRHDLHVSRSDPSTRRIVVLLRAREALSRTASHASHIMYSVFNMRRLCCRESVFCG